MLSVVVVVLLAVVVLLPRRLQRLYRCKIDINNNKITISAENPEQEQAVEEIDVDDSGANLSIGFNVSYLIDAVNACKGELVSLGVNDENTSALITDPSDPNTKYVVMPMRL